DGAMGRGWTELGEGWPGTDYHAFVDLGAGHDPGVIAVGHVEGEVACIDVLRTFQGSREEPVQLAAVEATLKDLARRFHLTRVRVESWQGMSAVQSLTRHGLNVELFTPTQKSNAEEWPILAQKERRGGVRGRLARRTRLSAHEVLQDEKRGRR